MVTVHGLHHVTCVAADPGENLEFYTGVLGMRLVKRTVNQDAPDTYHFFFADGAGSPGTDLTFFPWPHLPSGHRGPGQAVEVQLAVPAGSLERWRRRLEQGGAEPGAVEERFGEPVLPFEDPHGLALALVEVEERAFTPWDESPVPEGEQIRGLHCVRLWVARGEPTTDVLTAILGLEAQGEEAGWRRFGVGNGGSGKLVDLMAREDGEGQMGPGAVHHVAWRVEDTEEQTALRESLVRGGHRPTPQIDRFWFRSVYFREPGGVLFELATEGPGFTVDEDIRHLGEKLILPPWLEPDRREIEERLPRLEKTSAAPTS